MSATAYELYHVGLSHSPCHGYGHSLLGGQAGGTSPKNTTPLHTPSRHGLATTGVLSLASTQLELSHSSRLLIDNKVQNWLFELIIAKIAELQC